jgi:hypothetical protein
VIRRANSLLEVWPGHPMATFFRSQAYALKHMGQEASDDCGLTIAATAGGFKLQTIAMCAWALGIAGRTDEARNLVQRLEHPPEGVWLDPVVMGNAYGGVADIDRAMEWFEKGFAERSPNMIYLKQGRHNDFARADPRFQALIKRMNFPR